MTRAQKPNTAPTNPTQTGRPQRKAGASAANKAAYNPNKGGIFQHLKTNLQIQYGEKTYTDKKFQQVHEAIVVFNPYAKGGTRPPEEPLPGDYGVRVRCHIPALYKHLPDVTKQGNFTCQSAGLYPEFVAASLEAIGLSRQPVFGEKIKVQLFDHHQSTMHYSNGFVVGTNGSWGAKVRPNLPSKLEVAAKRICADKNTRFKKIRPPQSGGGINGPGGQPGGPPQVNRPSGSSPPPPQPSPAPNPSCDKAYVLEQLRNEFYLTVEQDVVKEIKKKIWWHDPTAERIAILHPSFRKTIVDFFVQLSKEAKPILMTVKASGHVRTPQKQREYYFQGLVAAGVQKPGDKPGTYFTVKPPPIVNGKRLKKVTDANEGESPHNYGLAVDIEELSTQLTSNGAQTVQPYYSRFSDPNTKEGKAAKKQLAKGQFPSGLFNHLRSVGAGYSTRMKQLNNPKSDPPHWEWRSPTRYLGSKGGIPWAELVRRIRIGDNVVINNKKTKYVNLRGF